MSGLTLPPDITSEQLFSLIYIHINRYERMIERSIRGDRQVRRGECKALLEIWKRIEKESNSIDSSRYSASEISEIRAAWFDSFGDPY